MATTYRPQTFNERFFEEPTIVNVPYSLPPEKLPGVSTPLVNTIPPAPDLSLNHIKNQQSQIWGFVSKNWLPILGVSAWVIIIYVTYNIQQKEKQKNNPKAAII